MPHLSKAPAVAGAHFFSDMALLTTGSSRLKSSQLLQLAARPRHVPDQCVVQKVSFTRDTN